MNETYTIEALSIVINRFKQSHVDTKTSFEPLHNGFEVFNDGDLVWTIRVADGDAVFDPPLRQRDRLDCYITEAEIRRFVNRL